MANKPRRQLRGLKSGIVLLGGGLSLACIAAAQDPWPAESAEVLGVAAEGGVQIEPAEKGRLKRPKEMQPYLHLLLEHASAAEIQSTLKALASAEDPDFFVYMVQWRLDQEDYFEAHYWSGQARQRGILLPIWQRAALALHAQDKAALASLLAEKNEAELPLITRVEMLRALGRAGDALALATTGLESGFPEEEEVQLRRHVDQLTVERAMRMELSWGQRVLGPLSVHSPSLRISGAAGLASRLEIGVTQNRVHVGGQAEFRLDEEHEQDAFLQWRRPSSIAGLQVKAGVNLRDDENLIYGLIGLEMPLADRLALRLEANFNELTEETPALRALGVKDRLSAALSNDWGSREYGRIQLDLQRYHSRNRERLADGYRIEAELGSFLLKRAPVWSMRLQGVWADNRLVSDLPENLLEHGLAAVDQIVPDDFSMMGFGTRVAAGELSEPAVGRWSSFADAWLGWAWPADKLAYSLQLGAGAALTGRDRLRLASFYSNTASGGVSAAYYGVRIGYAWFF
jgi:hypothetical protein